MTPTVIDADRKLLEDIVLSNLRPTQAASLIAAYRLRIELEILERACTAIGSVYYKSDFTADAVLAAAIKRVRALGGNK